MVDPIDEYAGRYQTCKSRHCSLCLSWATIVFYRDEMSQV
jgi:hypothetical protein